jgi:hypothetical protein
MNIGTKNKGKLICNSLNDVISGKTLTLKKLVKKGFFIPEPTARSAVRGYKFPPAIYTRGTKALAKSKVHQSSWAWLTNDVSVGGHPH